MTQPVNPALTGGRNHDGQNSLAKESKAGLAVAFIGTAIIDGLIKGLTDLDVTDGGAWWSTIASAAVATVLGLLTAYKKKNR
jgi:uncharacterized membrane protein HdeD (DUF308 family)